MTSEYALSKHRFYELKHFCLQYPEWLKAYNDADGYSDEAGKNEGDTTSKDGMTRAELWKNIRLVQKACHDTGYNHWGVLLAYVTGTLKVPYPGEKELFFFYYRKFFYILSKRRA
jgi:hypothetical protein